MGWFWTVLIFCYVIEELHLFVCDIFLAVLWLFVIQSLLLHDFLMELCSLVHSFTHNMVRSRVFVFWFCLMTKSMAAIIFCWFEISYVIVIGLEFLFWLNFLRRNQGSIKLSFRALYLDIEWVGRLKAISAELVLAFWVCFTCCFFIVG